MITFLKFWGLKDCHFGEFWIDFALLTRTRFRAGDLIRLRNRSKLVEEQLCLFAVNYLLLGAKFITLYCI